MDRAGKQFVLNSVCAVSQVCNIEQNYAFDIYEECAFSVFYQELDEKVNIILNLCINFIPYKGRC